MIPIPPVLPVAQTGVVIAELAGDLPFIQAAVLSAPERLTDVPRLLTLGATAIAMSDDGIVQLRTSMGDLFLRPSTPLPLNRPLTLQIPPGAPPDQIFVSIQSAAAESVAEPASAVRPSVPPPPSTAQAP